MGLKQLVAKGEASPKAVLDDVDTSEDRVGGIKVTFIELSKFNKHLSLLSKDQGIRVHRRKAALYLFQEMNSLKSIFELGRVAGILQLPGEGLKHLL